MVFSTVSSSCWFGYSGSCSVGLDFQLSTVHLEGDAAADGLVDGSAEWTAEMRVTSLPLFVLVVVVGTTEKVGWWCDRVWVLLYNDFDERVAVFERAIVHQKTLFLFLSFSFSFLPSFLSERDRERDLCFCACVEDL